MPRVKPSAFLLGLYIPVLLLGLLLPRKTTEDIGKKPTGIISRILHEILYLTGPPEIFLNFLLFIPFFLALLFLTPALSRYFAALISCLTSAAAELAQSQISGRASSMRDFLSNSLGLLVTTAALIVFDKKKRGRSCSHEQNSITE